MVEFCMFILVRTSIPFEFVIVDLEGVLVDVAVIQCDVIRFLLISIVIVMNCCRS